MPTKFTPGARVVHKTLGPGTVTEAKGDSVRVELDADNGARERTFMASLGTIELADQPINPSPAKPQAQEPQPEPETNTMPDALLTRLNETLAARGRGSAQALGVHIKRHPTCIATWRNTGSIPASIRDAVTDWIEKPVFTAVRVEKTKPAPKAKPAPKLRLVEKTTDPPPPIRCAVDAGKILAAMGLTITTAWIQEDGIMRAKAVAVLP